MSPANASDEFERFIGDVEGAIETYLADPDRYTRTFKACYLDIDASPKRVSSALRQLDESGAVEKVNGRTPLTWRYLGEIPSPPGGDQ